MMPLQQQILSFLYHGCVGSIFGFLFSFVSLAIQNHKFIFRLFIMSSFMSIFTISMYIGLFHINGGRTHLYSIFFFLFSILLYYYMLYPALRDIFIKIIKIINKIILKTVNIRKKMLKTSKKKN